MPHAQRCCVHLLGGTQVCPRSLQAARHTAGGGGGGTCCCCCCHGSPPALSARATTPITEGPPSSSGEGGAEGAEAQLLLCRPHLELTGPPGKVQLGARLLLTHAQVILQLHRRGGRGTEGTGSKEGAGYWGPSWVRTSSSCMRRSYKSNRGAAVP